MEARRLLEKLLYYQPPAPEKDYSDAPKTGGFDLQRLVNRMPCWDDVSLQGDSRKLKHKKLVITDWSLRYFSENDSDKPKEKQKLYEFLLAEGAELYAWTGALTKITTLADLQTALRKIEPVDEEVVAAELAKADIAKSAYEIINLEKTQKLLLKLAPVLPFQPEHGINIELSFLNQLEPDVVLAILASLKSQKIYVVLSNSAIDKSLFSRIIPHISTMALSPAGVEFLKKFFDETTEMIFQRPVEVGVHNSSRERSNLINELIHSPYYARFISFTEFVRIHDDELSISIRNLNTLHTYTFMALENETINLTKILSGAAFKKFTLRTKESNIILPLTEATNIRLTSLALSGPAFKAAQYCQLLSATAATLETLELREINLTNSKDKTENFSTHLVPLEKLSTLIVTKESKLTEFNQFLERCPNLSVLRIQADSLVTFSSFKKETVFNKLTVLEIDQEISAEDLLELVKRSPNLTRLKVKKIYGKLPVDPGFINQQLTRFEVADADEDCLDTYSSFCRIFPNVTYLAIPFYGSAKKLNCRWHNLAQLTYEIMPDKNTCTDMLHLVELCPDAITINSDSSAQYTTIKKINTSKVKVLNVTRLVLNEASCDDQMRNLLGLCPNLKKIIVTDDMEEEKVIDFLLTCPPLKLLQGLQINPHIACTGEQLNNLWKRYPSLEAISIKLNDDEIRLLCMSTSLDINVLLRLESYSFSEYSEFNVEDNIEATLLEKMLAHLTNPDSAIVNFNVYTLGGFLKKKYLSKNSPNQTPGLAIDTNTESSTRPLVAKQIFTYKKNNSPHPASYRLDVRKVNASAQADKITEQKEYSSKKNLTALYEEKYADTADIYLGKIFIPDDHNGWFALPSLTTRDQILDLSADAPVMLGYCEEKALYYVKPLTARKPKHVSFIVKASNAEFVAVKMPEIAFERLRFNAEGKLEPSPVLEELNKLSEIEKISALSQFLHTFSSGKLPVTANTRFEKINALLEFRKGACRHVSWIFEAFAAAWGIEARIINNGLHMFVEVKCADGWKTLDLGGAESNIKIIPQQQGLTKADLHTPPDEKKEESKSVPLPPVTLSPNNPFTTWNTVKSSAKDYDSYCKELIEKALKLPPGKRNVLVTLNAEELPSFHAHLTRYVQQNKNDSCYLHHLADISTKEPQIKDGHLETTESKLISLARDAKPGDVLVANWSGYRAADIGYNTMQDTVRKLKSTPISKEAVIISVVTKDEIKRLGEDFYSRYRLISELPELVNDQPLKLQLEAKEASSLTVAEFYADDWQTVLLGQITVNGKTFIQKPGLLAQAITEKPPGLMLQNAPWHSEKFNLFISELLIKKSFRLNGETIKLPDGFVIQSRDVPYQLTSKMMCFTPSVVEQEQPLVLNSFTYAHFFQQLECKDNLIYHRTGWLEKNKEDKDKAKHFPVYVTETLPDACWAKLIKKAEEEQCVLHLELAPNVKLPEAMRNSEEKISVTTAKRSGQIQLITTNDLELAEEKWLEKNPAATVISMHEKMRFSDLIEKPIQKPSATETELRFESRIGTVWEKLMAGETVILKGTLSPQLARELETLFLDPPFLLVNGKREKPEGKLIILSDKQNPLSFIEHESTHYQEKDSWEILSKRYSDTHFNKLHDAYLKLKAKHLQLHFSFGQLREMLDKIAQGSQSNPFKAFFRLNPNDPILMDAKEFWEKTPVVKSEHVMERRHAKISKELDKSPYLFIVGPSGVGKSTYILNQLKQDKRKVIVGIDKLKEWLDAKEDERPTLFIDEANLEREGTWDILEGIFNKTPGILLEGKFYPLSKEHKAIFAGNFANFAGREQHRYFNRHGQIFNFKELPDAVLSEDIVLSTLKSVLPDLAQDTQQQVKNLFIEIYHSVNNELPNHPLTPRNLKNLCARLSVLLTNYLHDDIKTAAQIAVVDELSSLAPAEKIYSWLKLTDPAPLKQKINILQQNVPLKTKDFVVTASRKPALYLLNMQFLLRKNLYHTQYEPPGFISEGLPGNGKSTMVIAYLNSQGFAQQDPAAEEVKAIAGSGPATHFYYLTPTDPLEMEKTLIKAFHEGAVVVIDELNGLPLERLMNQLLSGVDPSGERARKKGFMIIGTQNPITFAEREKPSTAYENRFCKNYLPDYPPDELREIAFNICPDRAAAEMILADYFAAREYAKQNNKHPAPTPRDLFYYLAHYQGLKLNVSGVPQSLWTLPTEAVNQVEHTQHPSLKNEP